MSLGKTRLALAVVVLSALVFAGCSSDSSSMTR